MTSLAVRTFESREVLVPRHYVVVAPLMLVFSLISQPGIEGPRVFALWALINIVAIALVGVFFALGRRLLLLRRPRGRISWLGVLGIGGVLGIVKGGSTALGGYLAGLEPSALEAVVSRVPQALVLGAIIVGGISVGAQVRSRLGRQRRLDVTSMVGERLARLTSVDDIEAPVIKRALAETRSILGSLPADVTTAQQIVDTVVRPLSYELWRAADADRARESLTWLDRRILAQRTFSPLLVGVVWAVTTLPAHVARAPLAEAVLYSAGAGVLLALALAASKMIPLRRARWVVLVVPVVLVLWGAGVWGVALTWWGVGHPMAAIGIHGSSTLWALALVVLSGMVAEALGQRDRVALSPAELEEEALAVVEKRVSRELGTFLHGEVANKLLWLSNRETLTTPLRDEEREHLLSHLETGAWLSAVRGARDDESSSEHALRQRWAHVLDVDIADNALSHARGITRASALEVIDEALANAYRHGMAKSATIRLRPTTDGRVLIDVDDDGVGPRNGQPGLGSLIFDHASSGRWSLASSPAGGSRLSIWLDATAAS